MTDFDRAAEVARELGVEDGTERTAPCDLSGQWADEPGGPAVFARILSQAGVSEPPDEEWFTDLLDVYEKAYNQAVALTGLSLYGDHSISLEYEPVNMGGYAYTNWLLFVDGHTFYLGQDAKFVRRVLGQDFAQFLHEAFERADIDAPIEDKLAGNFDRDLLRASLAAGIVRGLDDIYSDQGEDFFEALDGLEAWSLSAD
jgi:hypothetical protein